MTPIKKHARILEAKNRQQEEEEGKALKKQGKEGLIKEEDRGLNRRGEEDKGLNRKEEKRSELTAKGQGSIKIEQRSELTFKGQGSLKVAGRGIKKNVHFEAEAIVLNAALEGELEVLKECIEKVSRTRGRFKTVSVAT